jgi:hypothetical protein
MFSVSARVYICFPRYRLLFDSLPWMESRKSKSLLKCVLISVAVLLHACPAERGLVANATEKGGQFWIFPPDYDTRMIELLKQSRSGADGPPSPEPGR